ncbi:unnamed protein product [Tilletia laevis]|uniref:Uncharacterized protein n=1 Tax=Tilletia caries TaxID=13290 RepID=A0ABN7J5B3_9BASI|nr:unnamed protein product [Tilletia caries]CAD6902161.1 unnamed protein product [Tilletia controversa]CAD6929018.1 unnamed protein product [Tilletia controversa]CAD6947361.1 unnamed protein product [Tilletia caries]CAD6952751.1 unnamed protein product [Tilletia laevis]
MNDAVQERIFGCRGLFNSWLNGDLVETIIGGVQLLGSVTAVPDRRARFRAMQARFEALRQLRWARPQERTNAHKKLSEMVLSMIVLVSSEVSLYLIGCDPYELGISRLQKTNS